MRPINVAARLRVHLERMGFVALQKGAPAAPDGIRVALVAAGPAACWIPPDHADAVPESLGRILSQDLRCRVTSVGRIEDVVVYEVADGGQVVEKLAVSGNRVLESAGSPHEAAVIAGAALEDRLREDGLEGLGRTFEQALTERRTMVLAFAARSAAGDAIEIDPLLACPSCGSAMRQLSGAYGPFYGCVRFPDCRGRLTVKQADAQRAAASETPPKGS